MIVTDGLTKKFNDFLAVDDVNLDVQSGEVLALLGPNGAGKTTTVRMLTSILIPTSGTATINGYDVVKNAADVRRIVGVLTEHHGLYGRMNTLEYLLFFGKLYGLTEDETRKRVLPLLDRFSLLTVQKKRLGEFSKGMRQKLALVRALINDPPVLLLDEPTSAMDPESSRLVRDAILSLRSSDRTIILCTHNLSEAEELADQIAIINQGKIILNDSLIQIKNRLLGYPIFKAELTNHIDSWLPALPQGVRLIERNENLLYFEVKNPAVNNPLLIKEICTKKDLVSFQEMPRRLEDAYLEAIYQHGGEK